VSIVAGSELVSERSESSTRRLDRLMRQRETLRPLFRAAWDDLAIRFEGPHRPYVRSQEIQIAPDS
jgi:hypothetical protein